MFLKFLRGSIRRYLTDFRDWWQSFITEFIDTIYLLLTPVDYSSSLFAAVFSMLYVSVVIFCIGRRLGNKGSGIFAIGVTFLALGGLSLYIWDSLYDFWQLYFRAGLNGSFAGIPNDFEVPIVRIVLGTWFSCSTFEIYWGFIFDPLTIIMMWVILFITLVVQIYCLDYMAGDPFQSKFYSYLSISSFFMLFLVSSDNYLQIFLGWEGVGLVSSILISFWGSRADAVLAGMKAMFMNRFGDLFSIAAMIICLDRFGSLNLEVVKSLLDNVQFSDLEGIEVALTSLSFCLIIAAMAKSAQLGLHMWLPDAMEGPTPVSALIHAATMVTAGIFILIRSSFILVLVPNALSFMAVVGGLTALFGASVACVQFDIKKVIAYSTCSQLGYMMFACGAGNFTGALFHLVNHAFFKAALSLSAGSVIHATNNEQDMRKMGALASFLPITFGVMVISSAASAGFPFLSGFYSKDYILEFSWSLACAPSILSYMLGLFGAFGTSVYSFRLLYLVFLGTYQGPRYVVPQIHESPKFMTFGLILLVIPSVLFGYLFSNLFIGQSGAWIWESCVTNVPLSCIILPSIVRQAPFILSVSGFVSAYIYYTFQPAIFVYVFESVVGKCLYKFLVRKWYSDDFLGFVAHWFMSVNLRYFWSCFEQGVLIYFGPIGLSRLFTSLSMFVDSWGIRGSLVYLQSIFYCLFLLGYIWFAEVNVLEHLWYLLIVQVIGIIYYLTRLELLCMMYVFYLPVT